MNKVLFLTCLFRLSSLAAVHHVLDVTPLPLDALLHTFREVLDG